MDITLITKDNMQGHYAHALIQHVSGRKVHAVYEDRLQYDNIKQYVHEEAHILMFVGVGFSKGALDGVQQNLQNMGFGRDIPFTYVYHVSTWGEPLTLEGTNSIVKDDEAPISVLKQLIEKSGDFDWEWDVGALKVLEALNQYQRYDFKEHPHSLPLLLKLTSEVYRTRTHEVLKMSKKGVEPIQPLWETQYNQMEQYIAKKLTSARVSTVTNKVVVLLYAERFENEIAHRLIKAYESSGYNEVIVLVGKQTRGDDMFHIRVSETLDAGHIAQRLNNGKGNKHASTVFLGDNREPLLNVVTQQLLAIFG